MSFDYEDTCRKFRLNVSGPFNLARCLVDRHVQARANKTALVFADEKGSVHQWTYGELFRLSNQAANLFRELGVQKGDRVALLLPSCSETYICYLAAFKIGAVAVPISTLFGIDGVEYRVRNSGANLVITVPEARPSLAGLAGEVRVLMLGEPEDGELSFSEQLERASPSPSLAPLSPLDPILLVYSSGTSGPAKGVLHTGRSLAHTIETEKLWTGMQEQDRHWNVADPTWLGGLMTDLFCAWAVGATVFKLRRSGAFDPEEAFRILQEQRISNLFAPPTAYRMMTKLTKVKKRYDITGLQLCTSAGEPLNPEVIEWGRKELGVTILDGYGQTEGIMMASNFPGMPVKPGSMGRPAPGVRLRLLTPQDDEADVGQPGEIAIHRDTPLLFKRYWDKAGETAHCYRGEWYCTGDSARRDEDGYLHFIGRVDDVIISAGYRIGPFEVESCILEHPAVAESAAVAKLDPEGLRGHIVKAYVVLKPGFEKSERLEHEIRQLVRWRLSQSEYPREIEFMEALPKTRSGKILRRELRLRP